jgi:hypothetical protein
VTLKLVAIIPLRKLTAEALQGEIDRYLRNFAAEFKREMRVYPPFTPWTSRPPRRGPRAGGRRTGAYGRGWESTETSRSRSSVTLINPVPYSAVVGGSRRQYPGQSHVLAARGWRSIQDIGPEVAKRNLPKFGKVIFTGR